MKPTTAVRFGAGGWRLVGWSAAAALAAAFLPALAHRQADAADAPKKYLVPDGSRATAVHRIPLLDEDEQPIGPDSTPAMPYSPRATCSGTCHNYEEIAGGWHFNAPDPKVPPGRPGQPWILVDLKTGTQLPVSARAWPGTYRPADVGLTPWKFTIMFGRHTPGGGYGEKFANPQGDPSARWLVSGKLEIDCQICHSGDPAHDSSNWATNIERENLRWAATSAAGIAFVKGIAKTLPAEYDFTAPDTGDDPRRFPPSVAYDKWRFNANKEVFFDIAARPPAARCYYCHTNRPVGPGAPEKWEQDEDVHLKSGLTCVDCHRNGNDHMMTRNYEGEPVKASVSNLTCRGCHLGDQSAAAGTGTMGGRLGAPVPQHLGIPTIHFEKLACTACHSGPYPGPQATHVQTSRAHGLGIKAKDHRDDAPPLIQWPVFMRDSPDGVIGPYKVLWPAFWGRMKEGKVSPVEPAVVAAAKGAQLGTESLKSWKPLTADQVAKTLAALAADKSAGEPVYVCGGRLYRLGTDGKAVGENHPAAEPCAWPVAHDVRPAAQSLGSGGCTDCHSFDSPVFFGQVTADSPADLGQPVVRSMYEFLGKDPLELRAWAMSYKFRPMFKVVGFATAGLIGAVLLLYAFMGLAALARWAARKAPQGPQEVG